MNEFIRLVSRKVIPLFLVASIAILLVLVLGRDYYQKLSGGYVLWKFPDEPGVSLNYKDGETKRSVLEGPIVAYFDSPSYIAVIVQDGDETITQDNVAELGQYVIVPLEREMSNNPKNHTEPMDKAAFLLQIQELGLAEPTEFVFIDNNS